MQQDTKFEAMDHREFNRHGEQIEVGETFSGVDYQTGLAAVAELKAIFPKGWTLSQFAWRWILMYDAVTRGIPGVKRPQQADDLCPC